MALKHAVVNHYKVSAGLSLLQPNCSRTLPDDDRWTEEQRRKRRKQCLLTTSRNIAACVEFIFVPSDPCSKYRNRVGIIYEKTKLDI
jgi:hypothetical protein